MTEDFKDLIAKLEKNGYSVNLTYEDVYVFENDDIKGAICEEYYGENYQQFLRKVCAEHKKCFDKWSKCPMYMNIEDAFKDHNLLLQHLTWLASDEGYEYSNSYAYYDTAILPRD